MLNKVSNPGAIVNCAAYKEGRRVANVELPEVNEVLKQSDQFVWIGLHEPGEEVLRSILSGGTRPRTAVGRN